MYSPTMSEKKNNENSINGQTKSHGHETKSIMSANKQPLGRCQNFNRFDTDAFSCSCLKYTFKGELVSLSPKMVSIFDHSFFRCAKERPSQTAA